MSKPKNAKKGPGKSPELGPHNHDFLFRASDRFAEMHVVYGAGQPLGLLDALQLAKDSGQPLPEWALAAALDVVSLVIQQGITTGKGQKGNTLASYRKEMEHFRRYNVVEEFRRAGKSANQAYEAAVNELEGRFGAAEFEAIKKSHLRVRKHLADPHERARYYRPLPASRRLTKTEFPGRRVKIIPPATDDNKQ